MKKSTRPAGQQNDTKAKNTAAEVFPVVGLGASAGGLEALKVFFAAVPEKSGMAYIVNVHLARDQPSLMPELLQRVTQTPVTTAKDGESLQPDHIYMVPPDKAISLEGGAIKLLEIGSKHPFLPIDKFFQSLARDQGDTAVAIVLSGTGTDGTLGIKEIKTWEGLVLVQSEDSAGHDGMPRSAIATGVVDMVLPPDEMPQRLVHYFTHLRLEQQEDTPEIDAEQNWLNKIFTALRICTGIDFSQYKRNTLLRRIRRRMGLNQITDHGKYLQHLRQHPEEVEALFRELLIGVTSFFRDPESFEILKRTVLPKILDGMDEDATFRAWIPGCSSGEEVFSLAIVIREILKTSPKRIQVQLFGTDIDRFAIEKAREGVYTANITADVGEERLQKFFTKEGPMYRIRKEIRECVVFSEQDLLKDPPFSRLHLLCCRNLLIYLDAAAQRKILPLFHYTLNPGGVLVLGASESIGGSANLFDPLDKKWKIFKRRELAAGQRPKIDFPSGVTAAAESSEAEKNVQAVPAQKNDIGPLTQRAILERFGPVGVLVDGKGNLIYVQGSIEKYLKTPSGTPTHNIMDMAREGGLRVELSSALRAAQQSGQPEIRNKLRIRVNSHQLVINLHVYPLQAPSELKNKFLVIFEDVDTAPVTERGQGDSEQPREEEHISALEKELEYIRESHQTTVEELETANEETQSTNEELQSANEELQSTNEELESSKEELQSLNEELQTVNAELQSKVEELSAAHDDMRNLLNSTELATIFVDNDLRIRRFTPQATSIINLIQTDIGRPLKHVVTNISYEGMITDLTKVIETLSSIEREVETTDHHWYKMRIIPYRTTDNRIDGAVITFASIGEQKKNQKILERNNAEMSYTWQLMSDVLDLNTDPLVVLDRDGSIVLANAMFAEVMNIEPEKTNGMDMHSLDNGMLSGSELQKQLQRALKHGENFQIDLAAMPVLKEIGVSRLQGKVIASDEEAPWRILLQFTKDGGNDSQQP